jgi:hypothetical protein
MHSFRFTQTFDFDSNVAFRTCQHARSPRHSVLCRPDIAGKVQIHRSRYHPARASSKYDEWKRIGERNNLGTKLKTSVQSFVK